MLMDRLRSISREARAARNCPEPVSGRMDGLCSQPRPGGLQLWCQDAVCLACEYFREQRHPEGRDTTCVFVGQSGASQGHRWGIPEQAGRRHSRREARFPHMQTHYATCTLKEGEPRLLARKGVPPILFDNTFSQKHDIFTYIQVRDCWSKI